jgi:arylsulfatase A-like enzyme
LIGAHAPEEQTDMRPSVRKASQIAIAVCVCVIPLISTNAQPAGGAVQRAAISFAPTQLSEASRDPRHNFASDTSVDTPNRPRRNVIIFIADGLRHDSVNATDAPTLLAFRERGVHFVNSHSLFPTQTTPNASAIATGHYLGDTGDFSNAKYSGYPAFNQGNFGKTAGTATAFLENDLVLADLDGHVSGGNFLNEESLLALARRHGFNTAAIGKLGPAAIQDISQLQPVDHHFPIPQTIILDDSTGTDGGVPLTPQVQRALADAGLGVEPTPRRQPAGTVSIPGTLEANVAQQKWFADAATKVILPAFVRSDHPFVLVFWSRDPDGSQHNQGDSLNTLQPGINGPTSKAGVANADANLKQLLDFVDADPALRATTDVFATSDHGFATISKHEIAAEGHGANSYSTQFNYLADGKREVHPGWLPPGFLAIDLAHLLGLPLFDPDGRIATASSAGGSPHYEPIDPTKPNSQLSRQHPAAGNGLIGGTGAVKDPIDAKVIVTAGGGTDLIYVANEDRPTAQKIVEFLGRQNYTGALFVDPSFGNMPGALPLSAVALEGAAPRPHPSIVVSFKSFVLKKGDYLSAVQVSDTPLQEGQGMHGGFGRDSTFNNMAAAGPDFKKGFTDPLPVSNADIAPTLAYILGIQLPSIGKLQGRVLEEALPGGPAKARTRHAHVTSPPTAAGKTTTLHYQELQGRRYFDSASFN